MTDTVSNPNAQFFARMNKAFWVIWLLFPLTLAILFYYLSNPQSMADGLTAEQIKCLGEKLSFGQGSTANAVA